MIERTDRHVVQLVRHSGDRRLCVPTVAGLAVWTAVGSITGRVEGAARAVRDMAKALR